MSKNPLVKIFTSLWLTVTLLLFSLVIIFLGTMAQEPMGLNPAVTGFLKLDIDQVAMQAALIKSADLLQWNIQPLPPNKLTGDGGLPVFPGGYLVGALLLINLLAAYIQRFKWSQQKAGVYISHGYHHVAGNDHYRCPAGRKLCAHGAQGSPQLLRVI